MKFNLVTPLLICLLTTAVTAREIAAPLSASPGALTLREVRYDGRLSDDEARFSLDLDVEAVGKGGTSATLFAGDIALLPAKLPEPLALVREGNGYRLVASRAGRFKFKLDLVARIQRSEPWNQVSFTGPAATIASISGEAAAGEIQLLNGTVLESSRTNGVSKVKGFLGADQTVALRWSRQGGIAEVSRKVLLTVDSAIHAQITPGVVKYASRFHYDIVQGNAPQLVLALPAAQTLTRLVGEQIRDWHTVVEDGRQVLTIEFIRPVENACDLTLYSEETADGDATLNPPRPLEVEREAGSLALSAEDMLVTVESIASLRQINAPGDAFAAWRFNARPFTLALKLKHIEPVLSVADRVSARLEETRFLATHGLTLNVEKAGIYAVELVPPPGFAVAEVRGEGVEDWKVADGKIRVNFSARVLGPRRLDVQLEQALKSFPDRVNLAPTRVSGATKETALIGVASASGIRLRTGELSGLREIPVRQLPSGSGGAAPDELLAYSADQPDWKVSVGAERLAARVVADVFNLITIGDGLVGGSATIRYSLAGQGVQEFRVKVPSLWKNVEFTGPNIRRKEVAAADGDTNATVWAINLQDKVWGGYTLVVTYDFQFDPGGATLPIAGAHALEAERETGSLAVTTAASLQLSARPLSDGLRRLDENELASADRALISRAVVLAYQYTGDPGDLAVDVKRYPEARVLEAVADRTQITSVLTGSGEMLTQASFMVKNNEKQFQAFLLPSGARLWDCYVNGRQVKPERNGEQVLVPLPRDANRDQAFAVDILYAENTGALASRWSKALALSAPRTDVPNTYAEWQIFVPPAFRLSAFGGSMSVAQGTTYGLLDAWEKFLAFYVDVVREAGSALLLIAVLAALVIALVISAVRRGWNGILTVLAITAILAVLSAMMLPALAKAKAKASRISSVNNLKQIGIAASVWSSDNNDRLPMTFEDMKNELGTDRIIVDPESGQRYVYLGGGYSLGELKPDSVLAYSPMVNGHCNVLFADSHVEQMTATRFEDLSRRGLVQRMTPNEAAFQQQQQAVMNSQLNPPANPPGGTANPATIATIHRPRIELPQSGQPLLFTKVLNVGNEPLSIRATVMPLRTFHAIQMTWQVAAFLLGLAVWWLQWRRVQRSTFVLTVALALVLCSVCSLLVQWRALHDLLIVGFPVAVLAVVCVLIWRHWPRGGPVTPSPATPSPGPLHPVLPPVTAALVLVLALNTTDSFAGQTATNAPPAPMRSASIVSAVYSGGVNDRVAALDATFQVSGAKSGEMLPLFGPDVAVRQFTVKGGNASLVRDDSGIAVRLDSRGSLSLQVQLLAKVAGDVTRRQLKFGIPPALSSRAAFALDEAEADVDFPAAISFKRVPERDKTRVDAVIGAGDRIELSWTPRVKRAAEVAATVFCQNASVVTFAGGVMNVRATMDYQVTQGELRRARVRFPNGQRLLRVEGASIRSWETRDGEGGQLLVVDLLKGISPAWRLTIETEKAIDAMPASVAVETPRALDVKRETGLLALRCAEELGLSVESASDLQRVDVEEFLRAGPGRDDATAAPPPDADKTAGWFSVFRTARPDFALRVRVEPTLPQIDAVVRYNLRIGGDEATLSAALDYTIKRAGVFALRAALPPGWRIERVTGKNISQHSERVDDGRRILEVSLKERTTGAYRLEVELARAFRELPRSLAVEGVHPLDAAKLTGYISVSAEPGVAVKTETFDGLTEIPAVSLPDYAAIGRGGSVLAYKFLSPEPKAAREWKLNVATETLDAWVRAEIVHTIILSDTLVSGHSLMRYDIGNAPVKELRVKVPAAYRNVEISGPNIRSHTRDGDVWRIELQAKTRGVYTLTIAWEQPRAKTNQVEWAGLSAEGVERETGLIAVQARARMQVGELNSSGLQRADMDAFPDWAGRPEVAAALVYGYARPGYRLTLDARQFNEAETLQALVDGARLTTVVADDGQMMTEMSLSVRNNGRQFLEVELPSGATVCSAFVAGQPIRPCSSNGRFLLPIQQPGLADVPVAVELTYLSTNAFPRRRGAVGFDSPKFDVPLKNARWELFLPPGYDYRDLSGTMTRDFAAATAASESQPSASFSFLDYTSRERANQETIKAELKRDVSEAKRQLAAGNVREASANYNRAKGNSAVRFNSRAEDADVRKLEKELQSAQASNLINAQNDFMLRNYGVVAGGTPASAPQQLAYDNTAAEQQWAKLQEAQEIVATKIQPLHVNLPVRGLRHAFMQVLQTEVGRPMSIRLLAVNTKAVNWPTRLALAGVGFVILWGVVVGITRAMPRRPFPA